MKCRKCGEGLTEWNWYPSFRERNYRICIDCHRSYSKEYYEETARRRHELAGEEYILKEYKSRRTKSKKDPLKAIQEMRKIVELD